MRILSLSRLPPHLVFARGVFPHSIFHHFFRRTFCVNDHFHEILYLGIEEHKVQAECNTLLFFLALAITLFLFLPLLTTRIDRYPTLFLSLFTPIEYVSLSGHPYHHEVIKRFGLLPSAGELDFIPQFVLSPVIQVKRLPFRTETLMYLLPLGAPSPCKHLV